MEGVYGPFMMFDAKWRLDDETIPDLFSDADLVMRIYRDGKRMYRNWSVVIEHLNKQTLVTQDQNYFGKTKEKFIQRHSGCPLLMYKMLVEGWAI